MGSNFNAKDIQKGFDTAGDLFNMFDNSKPGTDVDYSGDYDEKATMMELDARERAVQEKQRANKTAKAIRAEQEGKRSQMNTEWGRSGLAASGSRELVKEGRRIEGKEMENDMLFEGDRRADTIMDKGLRDTNLFRINTGQTPRRTTLSLGSKLYAPKR